MTRTVALKSSLEIGSVGTTSMVSTPANPFSSRVKTAFESIGEDLFNNAQSLLVKFSSISFQPALDSVKTSLNSIRGFADKTAHRFVKQPTPSKAIEMTTDRSSGVEEFKIEEVSTAPSLFDRAVKVVKDLKFKVDISRYVLNVLSPALEFAVYKVEALELPMEVSETVLEIVAFASVEFEHFAGEAISGLTAIAQPLQMVTIAGDVKKIATNVMGTSEKEETLQPTELYSLGMAVVSRICNVLAYMQRVGVISPAMHVFGRCTLVGALFNLGSCVIDLIDAITRYPSFVKLVKTLLNSSIAILSILLIVYVASHLQLLLLMLGTGSLVLNVATREKEHKKEVKEVH